MDLHTVEEIPDGRTYPGWQPGDAWLAGGTYLFSEPQPHVSRLVDLTRMGWEPLLERADGLEVAATCTVARLVEHPVPLFLRCARAFLASFKIWNEATVGGNLCNALPAGPMISLTAALDGECLLLARDGSARRLPVAEFVLGAGRTVLREGELLRSITLPAAPLRRPYAFRQASLYGLGRSAALVIGTRDGAMVDLTITASTVRPYRVRVPADASDVRDAVLDTVPADGWFDDVHGDPRWRRHMTLLFAAEILRELSE